MTIKQYNKTTGRQIKGMHCFECGEDEVVASHKQHGDKLYIEFKCLNCKSWTELPALDVRNNRHRGG